MNKMSRETQSKRFDELLDKMKELRSKKNSDYASDEDSLSNLRGSEQLGIVAWKGVLVRIGDKISRIFQIAKSNGKHQVKDESIIDTLLDLAIYSLLCIILFEEWLASKKEG